MQQQLCEALSRIFEKHRIVFWYDEKSELRNEFDAVDLPDVQKVEILNNEFQLKYRMLREQPQQKFLLYKDGPQPADLQNWLLDVQLAQGEFRANQAGLWLNELGLGFEFADLILQHAEFFRAAKRREALMKLGLAADTARRIRLKMLAVCASTEARVDSILEALLAEHASDRDEKFKLIDRCNLSGFLWEQVKHFYSYNSQTTSVQDFVIELFKSCFAMATDGEVRLNAEALVFLKRWKDSRQHEQSFELHSDKCAELLDIQNDLAARDYRTLAELDYFQLIDKKFLSDLVHSVCERGISSGECTRLIRLRRPGHWYPSFEHEYEAIDHAAQFMQKLDEIQIGMESLSDGVSRYVESWYQVDQLYRHVMYHFRKSSNVTLLKPLYEIVERFYSNKFLMPLGDRWQGLVDQQATWSAGAVIRQTAFFQRFVRPFLNQNKKVCVIISDGLRYEIGHELATLIRQEDRYSAELKAMVTSLPSYTQLGMAALLPHTDLEVHTDGTVYVDGQTSQGKDNRAKILQKGLGPGISTTVILAKELIELNKDACRELFRDNDVVYVYQNIVDNMGDKRETEEKVFDAAQDALEELVRIVKKLTAANASNLLITADHGFLFQNEVAESDFVSKETNEAEADYRDRRFLLGKNLPSREGLTRFHAADLGLKGEVDVQIPKSIKRLRLQGSGFRYVHGGCTLQEVIVPVIEVNKGRQSDVGQVDVEIIRGSVNTISTGQLAVQLYQKDAVGEKLQPRKLRVGLYSPDGELISDSHEVAFDFASDNPREREQKVRLVLSRNADSFNNQQVSLRLDEKIAGTSHYREYRSASYTLRRSFTSDFDFD